VLCKPYCEPVSYLQLTVPKADLPKGSLAELVDECEIADVGAARKPRLAIIIILERCDSHPVVAANIRSQVEVTEILNL